MVLAAYEATDHTPQELDVEFPGTFEWLQRTFRARGLPADEASDLAQETITRTIVHLRRHGQKQDELGPLMNRIARNLLYGRARSRRPANASLDSIETVFDPLQDPESEVLRREQHREMMQAVSALPTKQRRVVLMSLQGLAPQEMASQLNMQRGAVDVLLHRARRTLASRLADSRLCGALILLGGRLRSGARRLADRAWMTQQILTAGSQLGAALVTVAIVAVVSGVQGHTETARPVSATSGSSVVARVSAGHVQHGTGGAAPRDQGTTVPERPKASADVRGQHARLTAPVTNPMNGKKGTVGAEVWIQHSAHDGRVGPLVDQGSSDVCGNASQACRAPSALGVG